MGSSAYCTAGAIRAALTPQPIIAKTFSKCEQQPPGIVADKEESTRDAPLSSVQAFFKRTCVVGIYPDINRYLVRWHNMPPDGVSLERAGHVPKRLIQLYQQVHNFFPELHAAVWNYTSSSASQSQSVALLISGNAIIFIIFESVFFLLITIFLGLSCQLFMMRRSWKIHPKHFNKTSDLWDNRLWIALHNCT